MAAFPGKQQPLNISWKGLSEMKDYVWEQLLRQLISDVMSLKVMNRAQNYDV